MRRQFSFDQRFVWGLGLSAVLIAGGCESDVSQSANKAPNASNSDAAEVASGERTSDETKEDPAQATDSDAAKAGKGAAEANPSANSESKSNTGTSEKKLSSQSTSIASSEGSSEAGPQTTSTKSGEGSSPGKPGVSGSVSESIAAPTVEPEPTTEETLVPLEPATPTATVSANVGAGADQASTGSRNNVSSLQSVKLEFDPEAGTNILWTAPLGSQTYGNPVVAGGKIFIGTNNGNNYREKHKEEDRGVLVCLNEADGKFLWQLTRLKLEAGRAQDWPLQGICSTPCVEGSKLYVVTNRCELLCLDAEGFGDGENDGPYQTEVDAEVGDADIIWSLDMIKELGVTPHFLSTSSPLISGDLVYAITSNGVDEGHEALPSPDAPSFVAVNKLTGEVAWKTSPPTKEILDGQWASPCIGSVNGVAQVVFPGGDGWIYGYEAKTGELLWSFDCNPKEATFEHGGRGARNYIVSSPCFVDNSVIIGTGQDPENGEGVGHLWRIDATKKGDISSEIGERGQPGKPNPNSGMIWHYGGIDVDGSVTGKKDTNIFRRTISTVAVADGFVYAPDLSGRLHCVDLATGKRQWEADLLAAVWGSPLIVDGRVLLGDEEGKLAVYKTGAKKERVGEEIFFPNSIYTSPTIANGVLYIADRSKLFAIKISGN